MKPKTCLLLWLLMVPVLLTSGWLCPLSSAQDIALSGLPGVKIRVELNKILLEDGMQKRPIYLEVEERLRTAGIKVYTEKQWREVTGHPQLYIEVNASKVQDNWPFFTFSVNVHLMQDVYIMRDNQTALHQASTWFRASAGHGYSRDIRSRIVDMVEVFSEAYIEANQ